MIFFSLDFLSLDIWYLKQDSKGRGRPFLIPLYHFHLLHEHLHIHGMITAESSPLHMASCWTWTGNHWFSFSSVAVLQLLNHKPKNFLKIHKGNIADIINWFNLNLQHFLVFLCRRKTGMGCKEYFLWTKSHEKCLVV